MTRRDALALIAIAVALTGGGPAVHADLLFDRFGVTLALDIANAHTDQYQNKLSYPFLASSLNPTLNTGTVDYVINDWHGSWSTTDATKGTAFSGWPTGTKPSGAEPYDVEAMYFDDDIRNLYLTIVTSFAGPPGYYDPRVSNVLVVTGDIALDLNLNPAGPDGFNYDYGVNVNLERRPSDPANNATSGGTTIGNDVYRTANSDWYIGTPRNAATGTSISNFDPLFSSFSGSYQGDALVSFYQYRFYHNSQEVYETLSPTYIIEVTIPKSLIAEESLGRTLTLGYIMGCRNDVMRLDADMDFHVPEPGTLALLGLGLTGLGLRLRKRRRAAG